MGTDKNVRNRLLAKSNPEETIVEHTGLLEAEYDRLREMLATSHPDLLVEWEILRIALLYHDLGKINTKFQNKLYRSLGNNTSELLQDEFKQKDEIPHGNLSPAFLDWEKLEPVFDEDQLKILYQSIYYHHPRYIEKGKLSYLSDVIEKDLEKYRSLFSVFSHLDYFNHQPIEDYFDYVSKRIDYYHHDATDDPEAANPLFYRYVMVKGLLNRLDYAASGHIPVEVPNRDLSDRTRCFLEAKGGLREIQEYMASHTHENNVVIASTGIGKTEAGLLWIGNNKGFFTLPLRVSINALYTRIKEGEGIGFAGTALLHSDALAVMLKESDKADYSGTGGDDVNPIIQYRKAKQLSQPLTITTVDQLFKIVFKHEGFESVLATLAYSKVIIDEIQMYSPEIVACIIMGLKYISEIGGRFSIITATFPPVLGHFLEKNNIPYCSASFILNLKRHRMRLVDEPIETAVPQIEALASESSVLVIVNTVADAQALYNQLGDTCNKHLLHSRFIKRDRRQLEKDIMVFSESKQKGVWVTTQVVEASLDIDFDYLFTQLSTVDGLFQRMGRCFRKRELTDDRVNVTVFTRKSRGVGLFIDEDLFRLSREALVPYDGKLLSEKDKTAVIEDVYSYERIKDTDYFKGINNRLNLLKAIPAYEYDRKDVDEKFRNIHSHTVIPLSVFRENKSMIDGVIEDLAELVTADCSMDEKRLQRLNLMESVDELSVDVPVYEGKHITGVEPLGGGRYVKVINLSYDGKVGLGKVPDSDNFL